MVMAIRYFALIYGIVFLVVGVAGFIPGFVSPLAPQHPELAISSGEGLLFGLFPINILHNLVHIIFGIWGIVVWRSVPRSLMYAKSVAVIYAVLFVMGLIPFLRTTFGLIPLYGHDIWLHAVLAGVAGYFGFVARADTGEPVRT
jgi:hypothetical protein